MQELINKNHLIKISVWYSLFIIILIFVPSYFYTKSEIQNYKINQTNLVEQYALNIQRAIYDFNRSKNDIFFFPKSFNINAYIYDSKEELIYSTSNIKLENRNIISKKYLLNENRLDAKKLIVEKSFNLNEVYLKISILIISVGLFIFISAYLILKQTITPYKKANNYLDRFFNDAMHELKTPLGILQLNLELLEEKNSDLIEVKRSLNAVKNLQLTYEDIEYLMKQKRVSYTKENIDFTLFLRHRVEIFKSLAQAKSIKLNENIKENIKISINRIELQRVIDNTISNAIKYSNESSKINITLKKDSDYKAVLSIEDFGKGIKDKNKIFERYHREEEIKGGFGIGLNIVKHICKKNSIKIEVISQLDVGSTFTYYFS
ncbi:sensor histidine kinase [Halarcobacter ebronensis]|uniref:histidine kinase n=1 Tax=Halarcobacter ebronensis TaxID=1462615 RepID=A0A4Q1AN52_9BACT|nr:HAMP domain-containing sensor histidine kinase [Halarcobacter ebronensis]QKF82436.1 two-component system sensor histidine kinase [Halarcobacter ebronensis]RXK07543.1 two-component sensor histidine kinase [Halarcobacter ebronensis]